MEASGRVVEGLLGSFCRGVEGSYGYTFFVLLFCRGYTFFGTPFCRGYTFSAKLCAIATAAAKITTATAATTTKVAAATTTKECQAMDAQLTSRLYTQIVSLRLYVRSNRRLSTIYLIKA